MDSGLCGLLNARRRVAITYRHTDASDSPMFSLAPILPMFDVRCVNRPNSSYVTNQNGSTAGLRPVVRVAPPDTAAHSCTNDNERFPDPQRQEHNPVVPLYDAIEPQCKEQREHQQAAVHYKLATITRHQRSVQHVIRFQQ